MEVVYCYLGNKYLGKLIRYNEFTYEFKVNTFLNKSEKIEEFINKLSTSNSISNFIKSRVKDFNNSEVLKFFNLDSFDTWEMFKRVKGRNIYDNFRIMLDKEN